VAAAVLGGDEGELAFGDEAAHPGADDRLREHAGKALGLVGDPCSALDEELALVESAIGHDAVAAL